MVAYVLWAGVLQLAVHRIRFPSKLSDSSLSDDDTSFAFPRDPKHMGGDALVESVLNMKAACDEGQLYLDTCKHHVQCHFLPSAVWVWVLPLQPREMHAQPTLTCVMKQKARDGACSSTSGMVSACSAAPRNCMQCTHTWAMLPRTLQARVTCSCKCTGMLLNVPVVHVCTLWICCAC